LDADGIAVEQIATATVGQPYGDTKSGWVLALDEHGRPCGWVTPGSEVDGELTKDALMAGGSLYTAGTPLRGALDSALSSPASLGVVVDTDGKYAGVLTARKVLDLIEAHVSRS
jgi:osmoprotectant transport system ATP-binding protein